jgi:hypothetical protein
VEFELERPHIPISPVTIRAISADEHMVEVGIKSFPRREWSILDGQMGIDRLPVAWRVAREEKGRKEKEEPV